MHILWNWCTRYFHPVVQLGMAKLRRGYRSDVSDEEWAFCAPYLTLMKEDAPQREYSLRELYNGLRWFVRAGCPWRMLPNDLPPWTAVQQQTQRWVHAGCFETMAEELRAILRLAAQRESVPTAVILDSRTLQSTPESGGRGGYDGAKRRKGSKVHAAVDTLGHLLAIKVTAANEQDRAQVVVTAEHDAVHVVALPLHEAGRAVQRHQRVHRRILLGNARLEPRAPEVLRRVEVIDDLEARRLPGPVDRGHVEKEIEGELGAHERHGREQRR